MKHGPFSLGVADLVGRDASPRPVTVEAHVDWAVDMSRVKPDEMLIAELVLHSVSGGIAITGSISYTTIDTCHRCLDEFVTQRRAPVGALFDTNEDDDESYPLAGNEIDVEQLLRDEALLLLPVAQDCGKDSCTMASNAETDLNTDIPDDKSEFGSPFAVLKDLLESGE